VEAPTCNCVAIHSLFSSKGVTAPNPDWDVVGFLVQTELIFARDVTSECDYLVFGRTALQEVVESGIPRHLRTAWILLDYETDEMEMLLAVVQTVKGHHDYMEDEDFQKGI
jgi:hypothetical protein